MAKKRKIRKRFIYVFLLLIVVLSCFIMFLKKSTTHFKSKLSNLGYDDSEVLLIMKNVSNDNYDLLLNKYDESIIDLINSKGYDTKKFSKYYEYYSLNKKSNIQDIVDIINSGFDLVNYPASPLLASLVKEKYYINNNVARYLDYGNKNKISPKDIISIVNSKADFDYYTDVNVSNISDDNLILVNKYYHLPDGYEPNDLVTLPSKYNKGTNNKLRKEAADAFMNMVDGALIDNIILANSSAYRAYDYQVSLYDNYVKKDGRDNADIYSARPGFSEHQTGLALDINIIDSSFDNTGEAKWLSKNAYKYGFILRFPKNKEKITGYKYESWHYRYVGKRASKIIHDNDLTLEEYYAYYIENK